METENGVLSCTARGRLRTEGQTPLVGDRVKVTALNGGKGSLEEILPRKNAFIRPAVANLDLTLALRQASLAMGKRTHPGVVQCKDAFYGQHSPAKMPVSYELLQKWEAWKRLGVKASEMESAALFVVADALKCRCGSCFHVIWNQEREAAGLDQKMSEDTSAAVRVSVDALKIIIEQDRAKKK